MSSGNDQSAWWLYIIETRSGKLYTGIALDVERRFAEHGSGGARGAKFFRSDPPRKVVFRWASGSRSQASRDEAVVKRLNRQQKLQLVRGELALADLRAFDQPRG